MGTEVDGMAQKHATALILKGFLAVGVKIAINRERQAQKAHAFSLMRGKEAAPVCSVFAIMRNCSRGASMRDWMYGRRCLPPLFFQT